MKRKSRSKITRHGALYPTEEPGRTPARKRTSEREIEVEEADVLAEYDLGSMTDYEPVEVQY